MLPIAAVPTPLLTVLLLVALAALSALTAAGITRAHERAAARRDPAPFMPVLMLAEGDRVVTDRGIVTVTAREPLTGDGYLTVTLQADDGRRSRHDWPTASSVRILTPAEPTRAGRRVYRPAA